MINTILIIQAFKIWLFFKLCNYELGNIWYSQTNLMLCIITSRRTGIKKSPTSIILTLIQNFTYLTGYQRYWVPSYSLMISLRFSTLGSSSTQCYTLYCRLLKLERKECTLFIFFQSTAEKQHHLPCYVLSYMCGLLHSMYLKSLSF